MVGVSDTLHGHQHRAKFGDQPRRVHQLVGGASRVSGLFDRARQLVHRTGRHLQAAGGLLGALAEVEIAGGGERPEVDVHAPVGRHLHRPLVVMRTYTKSSKKL